jgi:hypothetical protein
MGRGERAVSMSCCYYLLMIFHNDTFHSSSNFQRIFAGEILVVPKDWCYKIYDNSTELPDCESCW